jgi:putative transcriptional regulator
VQDFVAAWTKVMNADRFDLPIPSRRCEAATRSARAVLASVLNTSVSTVRQWEIGDKHPSGPSAKLLDLLDRKGLEALI